MDEQNYLSFYFRDSQPQLYTDMHSNMLQSSFKAGPGSYSGGEPMELTNSNRSTYSNISFESYSSLPTVSSPNTSLYGSYEPQPYMTSFNGNGMTGTGYTDTNFDRNGTGSYIPPVPGFLPPKHTPSSLGWPLGTPYLERYKFFVKRGEPPYLELLPGFEASTETPKIVHLDDPPYVPVLFII